MCDVVCGGSRRRHLRGLRAFGRLFCGRCNAGADECNGAQSPRPRIAAGVCDGGVPRVFSGTWHDDAHGSLTDIRTNICVDRQYCGGVWCSMRMAKRSGR